MTWDRQVNRDGDTLADVAVSVMEEVSTSQGGTLAYLDLIAECLVALAWASRPDAGLRQARLEAIREEWRP